MANRNKPFRNTNNFARNNEDREAEQLQQQNGGGGIGTLGIVAMAAVLIIALLYTMQASRPNSHARAWRGQGCGKFKAPSFWKSTEDNNKLSPGQKVALAFSSGKPPGFGAERVPVRVLLRDTTEEATKSFVDEVLEHLEGFEDPNHCVTALDDQARTTVPEFGKLVHPTSALHGAKCRCRIIIDNNVAEKTSEQVKQVYKAFLETGAVATGPDEIKPDVRLEKESRVLFIVAVSPNAGADALPQRVVHMMTHKFSLKPE